MLMTPNVSLPLEPRAPGLWRTTAGPEWANPGGGLWGGYAIGLCARAMEAEPQAVGEALSLTLTYAAGLPSGELDVRTRRLRQGGSIGVWEVELLPAGSDRVGVHAIVTMARRPRTAPFAFMTMPAAPDPQSLPAQDLGAMTWRPGWAAAFDRRFVDGFPPAPGQGSRTLAWARSQCGPLDRALLGMVADMSPPRAFYALGRNVRTTTLSLSTYQYATAEDLAEVGDDFILIECDGSVGAHGASGERSSYWRRDGKLLATSEQLVWYSELKENLPE
jgi:hypothetical protein